MRNLKCQGVMPFVSLILLLVLLSYPANAASMNRVSLKDNGKALVNPSMGWTFHYYSNVIANYGSRLAPSDTLEDFPGLSVVYLRVPWSFIEIDEGKYNWELLDTPAQRWIAKGKRIAIRISCCESWMRYATPKWVQDAGAVGYNFTPGQGTKVDGPYWEPDYDDEVFMAKLESFLKVLAKRYDGNGNVDFIDVGSFGVWGEGHTHASTNKSYSLATAKKHIDLHRKYFTKTQLCISDDYVGHDKKGSRFPATDYAFAKGVTLRDDSIMVQPAPRQWYHSELAGQFWPTMPVILEHQHYGAALKMGSWDKKLWLQSVEDYHGSYMSIHWWPRIFLDANRAAIDAINRRMGYRLCIQKVSWPGQIKIGQAFQIKAEFANSGVAPCYPGGVVSYTLKDNKGGIASVLVDDNFNVKALPISPKGQSQSKQLTSQLTVSPTFDDGPRTFARNIAPGSYDLYISIGKTDGTPVFQLPHDKVDDNKRYYLGKIKLLAR